jgi:hypothetical protein
VGDKVPVIGAAGGAFGLSGFAAAIGLCCTVPWAVTVFGVTGAVAFARLAFVLPYAVVGAGAFLGLAFWLAYRRTAACEEGTCVPPDRRGLRWFVWIAAVFVAALSIVALTMQVTLF